MTLNSRPTRSALACCWSSTGRDSACPLAANCRPKQPLRAPFALKVQSDTLSKALRPQPWQSDRLDTAIASTTSRVAKSP